MPSSSMAGTAAAAGVFSLGAACGAGILLLLQQRGMRRRGGAPARRVPQPHPGWAPGEPQPPPYGMGTPMIALDPATLDKPNLYAFMISAVVPRPVAFVSSASAAGDVNLAPYSYFNVMSHDPPVLAIGMSRSGSRGGGKKDSMINIEETGEFVVNIMSDWFIEAANHTSGEFDRGVDEMALTGLTPAASAAVAAPRVAEAALAFECKLRTVHDLLDKSGTPTTAIVIAEVVMIHVAEPVTGRSPSGKLVVDASALRAVCRLGGVTYGRVTELYDIPRPGKDGSYPAPPGGGGKR
ncbi:MAG: hypothetical protein J3K34DRAFT_428932 [Monoraphidium minutum]|nr:MAG: hypothetical protein J3K34DRAFT_428932 [Monoraphidium minutum]